MASKTFAARAACFAKDRPEVSSQTFMPASRSAFAIRSHSGLSRGSPPDKSTTRVRNFARVGSRRCTAWKLMSARP